MPTATCIRPVSTGGTPAPAPLGWSAMTQTPDRAPGSAAPLSVEADPAQEPDTGRAATTSLAASVDPGEPGGDRDTFGRPEEFPDDLPGVDMSVVPGADHGFRVLARGPVSQDEALGIVVEATLEWIVRDVAGESAAR